MTRPLVFLFPGQSSRDPEMFSRLAAVAPDVAAAARTELCGRGVQEEALGDNRAVQLAVFGASRAWAAVVARHGVVPTASAGHSLGEYSHLVQAGALEEDAARDLVDARGAVYDAGPPGVMAALHPLGADVLDGLLEGEAAWLACDNSPTQVVIGGEGEAVTRVLARAEEEHYVYGDLIESRIPMHTPAFAPAAETLRPHLVATPWRPIATYWSNVVGGAVHEAGPGTFVELLARHVFEPVRWRALIEAVLVRYPGAVFLEVGPRASLAALLRRWKPELPVFAVDPAGTEAPEAGFRAAMEGIRRALA